MQKPSVDHFTETQEKELAALAAMSDEEIDTSDAPVLDWSHAERGKFYRPIKRQVTMKLAADLIAWFQHGQKKGYQTKINRALREYVEQHSRAK